MSSRIVRPFRFWFPLALAAGLAAFAASPQARAADQPAPKLKVLIVAGGHNFEEKPFFKLFADNPAITTVVCDQTKPAEVWDRPDLDTFDVVLLYDFQESITDAQKARFLSLFDRGAGLVVLHHALLSYQHWPEYERIAGGKYLLDNETVDGVRTPASTYEADVDLDVAVTAKDHPVTAGIADFHMKDEMYRGVRNAADIETLLTAEDRPLAWARHENKSRIVSIIIGHGPGSYDDPNFQRLLAQSIHWTAGDSQAK